MTIANVWRSLQGQARRWLPPKGGSDPASGGGAHRAKVAALLAVSLFGAQQAAAADPWPEPVCKLKNYDIITSTFHQSVAQMNDGGWKVWGEAGNPANASAVAPPVDIVLPVDGNGQTPKALLVTAGSNSSNNVQDVVLGNDGNFYAWGKNGTVLPTTYTGGNTNTVNLFKTGLLLPSGVSAGDVEMLTAGYHILALVTKQGAAYILSNGADAALSANGGTTTTAWSRVQTAAGVNLDNVIAVRVFVGTNNNGGAAIALTKESNGTRKLYTWGNNSRVVGGGSATTSHSYATELAQPTVGAGMLPKMIGVTGRGNQATSQSSFYVLYTTDPDNVNSTGTMYAMGRNDERQLGDFTTTSRNAWAPVQKPTAGFNATTGLWNGTTHADFTDVRMFSVQEHDYGSSSTGSAALIVDNGDVWTWGSNSGAMIGGKADSAQMPAAYAAEGTDALDPAIRGYLMASKGSSNVKARYIELGGHTTAFLPAKKPQYCYVGHKINGSMGDNTTDPAETNKWQFQCEGTAAIMLCGSDALIATNDTYTPIPVPDVPVVVGNAYDNDEWQGDVATTRIVTDGDTTTSKGIVGQVLTPATPINYGPVPYLDTVTGKVIVPPGTNPGDYEIKYRIKDNQFGDTIYADATIKLTVSGIKAIPDTATTTPGTPVTTNVISNDTHPADDPLNPEVELVGQPPNGTVVCNSPANGQCTYTPKPGFKGTDTYTYKVCLAAPKANQCDTTTVTVAVGEPPAIAAYPDADATTVNVPVTTSVLANDIAVGGTIDPASVQLVGTPTGPGTATVNCSNGYCTLTSSTPGTYSYTYKVCMANPNQATCTTSTVQVLVTVSAGTPGITAAPDFDATPKNTPVTTTVLYNDKAVGGAINPGSVSVTGGPGHGGTSVDPSTGKITYTPAADFVGTDTYTYQVCLANPNQATCTTTTVTVKVGDPAITAQNDSTQVPPGATSVTTPVLNNDTPVGGELDPTSVTIITPPGKGMAVPNPDGTVTYTPGGGFDGTDEYTYQVCLKNPKEACSTAKVSITDAKPDVFALIQMPEKANPGTQVTALLTFGNQGQQPAGEVTYKVTGLPQGLGTVDCTGATCTYDSATQTVTITGLPTTLASAQTQEVQLRWTVPADAADAASYTLTAKIATTTAGNPTGNDQDSAALTVQKAPALTTTEVTTTVQVPPTAETGKPVNGTVKYLNTGSVDATGMTYKVQLSTGTPVVKYKGVACTVDPGTGALSGCGLPATLGKGESLELDVVYTAPTAGDTLTLTSTVAASNDTDMTNNQASGPTKALPAVPAPTPDVTVSVAPPPTAVPGAMVEVPVTFENLGPATAEDVVYKVTLPPNLTDVSCTPATCTYNPATGEVTVAGLPPTLPPGGKTKLTLTYKAPSSGKVKTKARVDTEGEPDANKPNNTAEAETRIVVPGNLTVTKTVYEDTTPGKTDTGGSCGNPAIAKSELLIVEKNPTAHTLVWCFEVKNNGTEYLGTPAWDDPKLPAGTMFTPKAGTTLPLAPGATGTWYAKSVHDKSVLNTAMLTMPVTDGGGTPVPDTPPATGTTTSTTTFGMIYDPPFGVKVGNVNGTNTIRWTMVWVNDNVVPASNVTVSDEVKAPMTYLNDGTLACVPEGTTTVVSCTYDAATKRVIAVANFGADFGETVATAKNRLFIAFNVSIPAGGSSYENQGDASWTPPGALPGDPPLTSKTTYVPGVSITPVTPGGGVPTVTVPPGAGGHPADPGAVAPTPVAPPAPAPTTPKSIPVDNPLALLVAALGIMGLMARQGRRARR